MVETINVIYGSETGNSEAIAERISEDITNLGFKTNLSTMNTFTKQFETMLENKSQNSLIIIVCSTCGNGDYPKGSDKFIKTLKKVGSLEGHNNIHFALLGLGDSNYSKFHFVPKLVFEHFTRLKFTSFVERGYGDDAYGLEEVVEPWIDNLLEVIKKTYKANFKKVKKEEKPKEEVSPSIPIKKINSYNQIENQTNYRIKKVQKISGVSALKEIYKISLENTKEKIEYSPGSHLSILSTISSEKISLINKIIDIKQENSILSTENTEKSRLDSLFLLPLSFVDDYTYYRSIYTSNNGFISKRDLLGSLIDFTSIIKKLNLEKFVLKLEIEKERKLKSMSINEEKKKVIQKTLDLFIADLKFLLSDYQKLVFKNKVSFYDLLSSLVVSIEEELKENKIEFSDLIDFSIEFALEEIIRIFHFKIARKYSISTNPKVDNDFQIAISVLRDQYSRRFPKEINILKTNTDSYYLGECSNYLKSLVEGSGIYVCDVRNQFPFPETIITWSKPLIYVSNGTGVTPCISYLKGINEDSYKSIGKITLVSGIRSNSGPTNEAVDEDIINNIGSKINKANVCDHTSSSTSINMINKKFNYITCISVHNEEDEEDACGEWRGMKVNFEYVQDIIAQNRNQIYQQLFIDGGVLMICGDLEKIYDDIINLLVLEVKKVEGVEKEVAEKKVEELKINEKILVEKWN